MPTDEPVGDELPALIRLLVKRLGIPKSNVSLVSGATARNKIVEIEGVTEAELRKEVGARPGPSI